MMEGSSYVFAHFRQILAGVFAGLKVCGKS